MGFIRTLLGLNTFKQKLRFMRLEIEEALAILRKLVETYEAKVGILEGIVGKGAAMSPNERNRQTYWFKQHISSSHEGKQRLVSKISELLEFVEDMAKEEKNRSYQQVETRLKDQFKEILELGKRLDHILVQQAIFFHDENAASPTGKRAFGIVLWTKQEIALLEQLDRLFDTVQVELENMRLKVKQQRFVEQEYESVRDENYPQIRGNVGG